MSETIFVNVEVNYTEALRRLNDLKKACDDINGRVLKIDFGSATGEIKSMESSLKTLVKYMQGMEKDFGVHFGAARKEAAEMTAQMENLGNAAQKVADNTSDMSINVDSDQVRQAASDLDLLTENVYTLRDALGDFADLSNTIGDVFGGIAKIGSSVGDMFSDMSGMFGGDILSTIEKTLIGTATGSVTSRFDDIVSRFDIMNTFVPYMELSGATAEQAEAAKEALNKSILGLPIGLSDAVQRFRRYNMYLDDVERAQNLTIGLQHALIAGGAPATMRYSAYHEIDRLLATGKLSTSRQWQALINGLGVSAGFLREAMGYGDMDKNEFFAMLSSKDFDTDEVLRGFEVLADETTEAGAKLAQAIEIYKTTLESWLSNLNYAIIRGGETILRGFNTVLSEALGMDVTDLAEAIRGKIDEVAAGAAEYLENRPEIVQRLADAVSHVFERLEKFDWAGLADKVLNNIADIIDALVGVFDAIGPEKISDFIAFATTWAGPLGEAITALADGLPMLFAVFERLKDVDWADFIDKTLTKVEHAVGALSKIFGLFSDDFITSFLAFSVVYAPLLSKAFHLIGGVISTIAGIAVPAIVLTKIGTIGKVIGKIVGLAPQLNLWKGYLKAIGGAALFVGLIAEIGLVIREFAWVAKAINELDISSDFGSKLDAVSGIMKQATGLGAILTGIFGFLALLPGGQVIDLAALIGEGLAAAFVGILLEIAKVMKTFAEAAKTIGDTDITDFDLKIEKLFDAMNKMVDICKDDLPSLIDAEQGASHLEEIVESFSNMKTSLMKLSGIDKIDIDIPAVTERLAAIVGMVKGIHTAIGTGEELDTLEIDAGRYANVAASLASTFGSLGDMAQTLRDMMPNMSNLNIWFDSEGHLDEKTGFGLFARRLGTILGVASGVFEQLEGMTGKFAGLEEKESSHFPTIVSNINDTIKEFSKEGGIMDTFGELQNVFANFAETDIWENDMEEFTQKVEKVVDSVGRIYLKLSAAFPDVPNPVGGGPHIYAAMVRSAMIQFKKMMELLPGLFTDLLEVERYFDRHKTTDGRSFNDRIQSLESEFVNIFANIGDMLEAIGSAAAEYDPSQALLDVGDLDGMFTDLEFMFDHLLLFGNAIEGIPEADVADIATKVEDLMKPVGRIMQSIKNLGFTAEENVTADNKSLESINGLASQAEQMRMAIGHVVEMAAALYRHSIDIKNLHKEGTMDDLLSEMVYLSKALSYIPNNADEVKENADHIKEAIDSLFTILETLDSKQELLEKLKGNEIANSFGSLINDMVTALVGESDLETVSTTVTTMNEIIAGLKGNLESLQQIDLKNLVQDLEGLGGDLDTLTNKVNDLAKAYEEVKKQADNAKKGIDSVADTAVARQGDFSGLEGAIRRVREVLQGAAAQADNLTQAINNIPKNTDIRVNYIQTGGPARPGVDVVNGFNLSHNQKIATGGIVYAASGFQKRGTDVVPAMLTPGEFVVRKAAVDSFGVRLMRQINSLNIEGAMREMFSYTGLPVGVNSVVDNSRSYDSHNSVTQNVYSNNPNYSKKRAYKGLCMA